MALPQGASSMLRMLKFSITSASAERMEALEAITEPDGLAAPGAPAHLGCLHDFRSSSEQQQKAVIVRIVVALGCFCRFHMQLHSL